MAEHVEVGREVHLQFVVLDTTFPDPDSLARYVADAVVAWNNHGDYPRLVAAFEWCADCGGRCEEETDEQEAISG